MLWAEIYDHYSCSSFPWTLSCHHCLNTPRWCAEEGLQRTRSTGNRRVDTELNKDEVVLVHFHFSSVLLLNLEKKAFYTLREALKERDCARLKLKYVPGGCELRLGCHLFSYFHFQRGLCSNFPAISLGLGVANCQCGFSGKLIRVHAIVLTWPLPEKMPAHYW